MSKHLIPHMVGTIDMATVRDLVKKTGFLTDECHVVVHGPGGEVYTELDDLSLIVDIEKGSRLVITVS